MNVQTINDGTYRYKVRNTYNTCQLASTASHDVIPAGKRRDSTKISARLVVARPTTSSRHSSHILRDDGVHWLVYYQYNNDGAIEQ